MQLVGADFVLGALERRVVVVPGAMGDKLRRDFGVYDRLDNGGRERVELLGGDDPAQEVLDQGFRHGSVDVVVRHLIADAVGRPPQRHFAEVAGAQHEAVVEVC